MDGSLRKASQKGMAHNNRPNAELSKQMKQPPIRRICNNAQEAKSEGGNSLLMFLKLPRLERRPVVKSKTPSSPQENEQKNESFKSYVVIHKNFPPLQAAAKQGACSLERGGVLRTLTVLKKLRTFILACTELRQYAAKVIRLRARLLKLL